MGMAIQGASSSDPSTAIGVQRQSQGSLDRDDFMTLLVTQLQHQDPMEPVKDQEFAAQLAQFSSLEAVQNLSLQFNRFVDMQQWSTQLGQATGLIGKTVDVNADGATVTGQVSAVRILDGLVHMVVNGQAFDVALLSEVRASK